MFKSPEFILRTIKTHWKVRHEFYKDLSGCYVVRIGRGEEQDSKKDGGSQTVGGSSRERRKRWIRGVVGGRKRKHLGLIRFEGEDAGTD